MSQSLSGYGQNLTLAAAGQAEFLGGLSRQALFELVRSEGLAVRSERAVYEAVMGWVRHDVASRKAWLGEMLGGADGAAASGVPFRDGWGGPSCDGEL